MTWRRAQSTLFSPMTVMFYAIFLTLLIVLMAAFYGREEVVFGSIATSTVACAASSYFPLSATQCAAAGTALAGVAYDHLQFMGGPDPVQQQLDGAVDVRDTVDIPLHFLVHQYDATSSVRQKLQAYIYCKTTSGPPNSCSIDDGRLKSVADTVMQEPSGGIRDYTVSVIHGGSSLVEISSGGTFEEGPTVYMLKFPVYGGKQATIRFKVEGAENAVTWR